MSNPVPASIALASIAGQISASPLNSDYSAIQTAVNALITALGGGSANQVLQAVDSTHVQWGGAPSTYTPSWLSSGVAPALGNGTITGRYIQIGKLVYVQIKLTIGSTSTFGTGSYFFDLPVGAHAADAYNVTVQAFDTSGSAFYAGSARPNGGSVLPITLAAPVGDYNANVPFTWAVGDTLTLTMVYEAA